jgi:hypothetical protein
MLRSTAVTLSLALLLLAGCVSSGTTVSSEVENEIPEGATSVVVQSTSSPEQLYTSVYQTLTEKGYPIQHSNDEMRSVTTEFKEVGQATTLSVSASVHETDTGATLRLQGRWGVTGSFAAGMSAATAADVDKNVGQPAKWKPKNRAGVAFGALASLAQEVPHQGIRYKR